MPFFRSRRKGFGGNCRLYRPRRALSFVQEIRERCHNLTQFPEAAPLREVLGPAIRIVPFGRYVIFYTLYSDVLRVERILAAARFVTKEYFE